MNDVLIFLKFKFLGFKQRFEYSKNEKINFIKVILKLECLFYHIIFCFILFYIRRAISTQTNPKSATVEKKNLSYCIINTYID